VSILYIGLYIHNIAIYDIQEATEGGLEIITAPFVGKPAEGGQGGKKKLKVKVGWSNLTPSLNAPLYLYKFYKSQKLFSSL